VRGAWGEGPGRSISERTSSTAYERVSTIRADRELGVEPLMQPCPALSNTANRRDGGCRRNDGRHAQSWPRGSPATQGEEERTRKHKAEGPKGRLTELTKGRLGNRRGWAWGKGPYKEYAGDGMATGAEYGERDGIHGKGVCSLDAHGVLNNRRQDGGERKTKKERR